MSFRVGGTTFAGVRDLYAISPNDDGYRVVACGAYIWIGARASIGDGAAIGAHANIGAHATIGERARGVLLDLGPEQVRGHARLAYIARDGRVRIAAGCRDYTIAQARRHWGAARYPDRARGDEYLALIDCVARIAKLRGVAT